MNGFAFFSSDGNKNGRFVLCCRENHVRRNPMKEFHCGSLVPGCEWHTRAEEEAEVMRRAVQHMRETHGETTIRETMVEAIRSRIDKVRDAA
jgi:predicted small metal-binding protein